MTSFSRRKFLATGSASLLAAGFLGCDSNTKSIGKTPHTKFAVNIEIWWKDLPVTERIKKTAEYGFPAIEFWGYDKKDLSEIRDACDELGIVVTQFTAWGFKPPMNNPENHDLVEQKIIEAKAQSIVLRRGD